MVEDLAAKREDARRVARTTQDTAEGRELTARLRLSSWAFLLLQGPDEISERLKSLERGLVELSKTLDWEPDPYMASILSRLYEAGDPVIIVDYLLNEGYAIKEEISAKETQATIVAFFAEYFNDSVANGSTFGDIDSQCDEMLDRAKRAVRPEAADRLASLGRIAARAAQAALIQADLAELVFDARRLGAPWADVGRALGTSSQAAWRKWDPEARRKHSDYQRQRKRDTTA